MDYHGHGSSVQERVKLNQCRGAVTQSTAVAEQRRCYMSSDRHAVSQNLRPWGG